MESVLILADTGVNGIYTITDNVGGRDTITGRILDIAFISGMS